MIENKNQTQQDTTETLTNCKIYQCTSRAKPQKWQTKLPDVMNSDAHSLEDCCGYLHVAVERICDRANSPANTHKAKEGEKENRLVRYTQLYQSGI